MEKDAYVLCRVFHKNNIGPPNGQRYAPFIEEEWDDASGLIPGAEHVDEVPAARHQRIEGNGHVGYSGGIGGSNVMQGNGHVGYSGGIGGSNVVQVCSFQENYFM